MNAKLQIERLILDDANIAPGQLHILQASAGAESTPLFMNGGLVPGLAQFSALRLVFHQGMQSTGNTPTKTGQQTAQSVYRGNRP